MLKRPGMRFALEVLVIVGAAVATGLAHFGAWGIGAAVFGVWIVSALFEYRLAHSRSARERVLTVDSFPEELELPFEHVRVLTVRAQPAREPEHEVEPEPAAAPEPVATASAREPEPPAAPEPAAVATEPEPLVAFEPDPQSVTSAPWSWNIWNLERVARERGGDDEELHFLLLYLRDYAGPDGMLPADFDALVRESFGKLLAAQP